MVAISNFATKLGEEGIGFFYYSGHGAARAQDQVNYLIPVDLTNLNYDYSWYDAVSLNTILNELVHSAPKASLFFVFDACRNELRLPVKATPGGSKGFEVMRQTDGVFIAFSTGPNQTAPDPAGNAPGFYARALASELVKFGQDQLTLFQNVKETVFGNSGGRQRPWESNGFVQRIYLAGRPKEASKPPALATPTNQFPPGFIFETDPPRVATAALAPAVTHPVDPKTLPQNLEQLRTQRQVIQEGNRTVIRESDRVIIREGGHDIIRHDESARFAFNAREVNVEHRGNATVTIALRPDGSRIITEVDDNGRLLRRVRRDAAGREFVIIDNTVVVARPGFAMGAGLSVGGIGLAGGAPGLFVDLAPPVVRIASELYIRETARATPDEIYRTLAAPPVERIDRRYTLDQIRYSEPLRARMPRIDIDTVNFEFGSWEVAPDQVQRLAGVAQGIMRAVQRNPAEVFLIEGHTDAVGNDVDLLSLSDRRAESVAVVLTNQFGVPPENLTSQGYGKQFLKIPTPAPERANRRVAVRRITPLLTGQN
jgi:outer membrane protein OmpA-like peptidoglycan-associated protein